MTIYFLPRLWLKAYHDQGSSVTVYLLLKFYIWGVPLDLRLLTVNNFELPFNFRVSKFQTPGLERRTRRMIRQQQVVLRSSEDVELFIGHISFTRVHFKFFIANYITFPISAYCDFDLMKTGWRATGWSKNVCMT